MTPSRWPIRRPRLARSARYRWDKVRQQHQIVYSEGVLVLNETAAAIARLCDGRSRDELIAALRDSFASAESVDESCLDSIASGRDAVDRDVIADVDEFLGQMAQKGIVRDADDLDDIDG